MKQCIINQFFGLGDILFVEPICRHYQRLGYTIVFPVLKKYLEIKRHFPYITFIDKDEYGIDYDNKKPEQTEDNIILPLRWSREVFNEATDDNQMRNKYKMVNLPLSDWRKLTWVRFVDKENELKTMLTLKDEPYVLVNKNWYSFENKTAKFKVKTDKKIVNMNFISGYTMLDWSKVIEDADEIHTVNTSLLYLLETLELKTNNIHLYPRLENNIDLKHIDYLLSKNYTIHANH